MTKCYTLDDLLKRLSEYILREESIKGITLAYEYAKQKHEGQYRKSGEPYITHPLEVAIILTELRAGPNAIMSALLHDVVEDCNTALEEIDQIFGPDIASLVDGVTKLTRLEFASLEQEQASNHQKMLLAMAKDIRVVIIKLADRLHNMRTMHAMILEKQIKKSQETLEIFAPLAHRLGMYKVKAELEDRALRYVDGEVYHKIKNAIGSINQGTNFTVDQMIESITNILNESEFNEYAISGRLKNVYSIYKKILKHGKEFSEIFDVFAIRIIVDKIEDCYRVLGIIHSKFTPLPKRIKDYIAVPKPNLYQSLHTTIVGQEGQIFEVQIRTKEMDRVAEYGIAAHWGYKENIEYSKEKEQNEMVQRLRWYKDLIELSQEQNTSEDYIDFIKTDIFDANVYVYTPNSEVVSLPKGATPIDFAYKIHTNVGNTMSGAIVNQKIVPLGYELQLGDVVSIKTSKNTTGPTEDWLKIAKSSHTRHKIKSFLNKQNKDVLLEQGKSSLTKELSMNRLSLDLITDEFALENFSKYQVNSVNDLFVEIAKGNISAKTVLSKLQGQVITKEEILKKQMEKASRMLTTNSDTGVVVEGIKNPQIKLANCCHPIPGDEILGYVSKTQGIVVHHKDCKNLDSLSKQRFLSLDWTNNPTRKYVTSVKIFALQDNNLLGEIMTCVSALGISISSINAINTPALETIIAANFLTKDTTELEKLMANIKKISSIQSLERVI